MQEQSDGKTVFPKACMNIPNAKLQSDLKSDDFKLLDAMILDEKSLNKSKDSRKTIAGANQEVNNHTHSDTIIAGLTI